MCMFYIKSDITLSKDKIIVGFFRKVIQKGNFMLSSIDLCLEMNGGRVSCPLSRLKNN